MRNKLGLLPEGHKSNTNLFKMHIQVKIHKISQKLTIVMVMSKTIATTYWKMLNKTKLILSKSLYDIVILPPLININKKLDKSKNLTGECWQWSHLSS